MPRLGEILVDAHASLKMCAGPCEGSGLFGSLALPKFVFAFSRLFMFRCLFNFL